MMPIVPSLYKCRIIIMQEGTPTVAIKTLTLDSSFEFNVKKDDNKIWKLKDGLTLVVELRSEFDGILEFNIPVIMSDGYVDLRDKLETVESVLKDQLGFEISIYALEKDEKLVPKAVEKKRKLLEVFERK